MPFGRQDGGLNPHPSDENQFQPTNQGNQKLGRQSHYPRGQKSLLSNVLCKLGVVVVYGLMYECIVVCMYKCVI